VAAPGVARLLWRDWFPVSCTQAPEQVVKHWFIERLLEFQSRRVLFHPAYITGHQRQTRQFDQNTLIARETQGAPINYAAGQGKIENANIVEGAFSCANPAKEDHWLFHRFDSHSMMPFCTFLA
jgi:hypothetical protein